MGNQIEFFEGKTLKSTIAKANRKYKSFNDASIQHYLNSKGKDKFIVKVNVNTENIRTDENE